jgi:deoxyhypusine synthase
VARRTVEDIRLDDRPGLDALVRRLGAAGGFSARGVSDGVDLLERMFSDRDMTIFLSFPAAVVATGTRGVLAELLVRGLADVVVTTCGTLDHDLARAEAAYYHGDWSLDDVDLRRRGLYRLGNLVIPERNYGGVVERRMQRLLEGLWKRGVRRITTPELVWALGEDLGAARGKGALARLAFERKIPVFAPGLTDGAVGSQLWLFWQRHRDFLLDPLAEEQALSDRVYAAKRSGAILLGGGISKHHTIWWNQFRNGLDAALYITTAVEYDGSLSGARTREAISWGKVKPRAPHVTVEGDVTVLLPLMVGAALERIGSGRRRPSVSP